MSEEAYKFDTNGYIEIPAEKVRDAIRLAYELSRPVGMGMLHFRPGPLDEETVEFIATNKRGISMDYVRGRQCKFHILDHLCRNPSCVNPAHLEDVTSRINTLRGIGPTSVNAKKTHCHLGHELAGENLVIVKCRNIPDARGAELAD